MIELIVFSFAAGILTVLAPCILPLLPIIIGGSTLGSDGTKKFKLIRPMTIIGSLIVSIVAFTLLLKSTTALLGIPASIWTGIAGGIISVFGINLLFPVLWEKMMTKTGLAATSQRLMGVSQQKNGRLKDVLLGAALGPVFNSCSPTYALIVAVVLPTSFITGLIYLIAYSLGLGLVLLLISIFGRLIVSKLALLSNPRGIFQKVLGGLFIFVGLAILFGVDKQVQTLLLDEGLYDPIMKVEESFRFR